MVYRLSIFLKSNIPNISIMIIRSKKSAPSVVAAGVGRTTAAA